MILAIDLGTSMGWFLGNAVGPCEWGTFRLDETTDLGRWLRSSDPFFQSILPRVTGVCVEKPNAGAGSAYPAVRKNMALLGHLHYHAGFFGLGSINEVSVSTGKLTLAGHGFADKDRMIAAAAEAGHEGMNEHEADALGIWTVHVFGARVPIKGRRKA